jgi:hypothetical protein
MLSVTEKRLLNSNFSLPPEIDAEFRSIGDRFGENNKIRWAVAAAAMLKLLELTDEEVADLVERLIGARRFPDRMQKLVDDAKAKRKGGAPKPKRPPGGPVRSS